MTIAIPTAPLHTYTAVPLKRTTRMWHVFIANIPKVILHNIVILLNQQKNKARLPHPHNISYDLNHPEVLKRVDLINKLPRQPLGNVTTNYFP